MAQLDLTGEEIKNIISMMESSSIQLVNAEKVLTLLNKFRVADGKTKKD